MATPGASWRHLRRRPARRPLRLTEGLLVVVIVAFMLAPGFHNVRPVAAVSPSSSIVVTNAATTTTNSSGATNRGGVVGALYLPDHNDEYPDFEGFPDRDKLRAAIDVDLRLLSKYLTHIRTLAAAYYGIDVVPIAHKYGLKVFVGMPLVAVRSEIRRQIRAIQRAVVQHPETIAGIMLGDTSHKLLVDRLPEQLEELKVALGPHAVHFKFGFVAWCNSEDAATNVGVLLRSFDVFGCVLERGDGQSLEVMLSRPEYDPTKLAFVQTGTKVGSNDKAPLDYYEGLMRWRPPWPGAIIMWFQAFDSRSDVTQRRSIGLFTADRHRKLPGLPRPLDPSDDPIHLRLQPYDEKCPPGTYYSLFRTSLHGTSTMICMASGVNFRNPTKFNELTLEAACANPWCHDVVRWLEAALRSPKCPFDDSMSNATIQSLIIKPFRQNCGATPQEISNVDTSGYRTMKLGSRFVSISVMVNNSTNQELCEATSGYQFESLKPLTQSVLEKMCFQPSCEYILFQFVSLRRTSPEVALMDALNVVENTILQPYYDGCYEASLLADDYFDIMYRKRKRKPTLPPPVDDRIEPLNDDGMPSGPNNAPNARGDVTDNSDSMKPTSSRSRSTIVVIACVATPIVVVVLLVLLFRSRRRRQQKTITDSTGHMSMSDDQDMYRGSNNGLVWRTNDIKPVWADSTLAELYLHPTSIRDVRLIGSGGQGLVYLVNFTPAVETDPSPGQPMSGALAAIDPNGMLSRSKKIRRRPLAAKRLGTHHATNDPEALVTFIAEIKLVASLQHPRIVSLVGVTWTNGFDIQALFEYMSGGDLCNFLSATKATEQAQGWTATKLQLAIDVIDALAYVHARTPVVVHRDIKSRNVLLSAVPVTADDRRPAATKIRAKLTDFGVARLQSAQGTMTTGVGTSRWLAPEVIVGGGDYNESCDVYSFGVLLSELDTHELPFMDQRTPTGDVLPAIALMEAIAEWRIVPSFGATCPTSLLALARACLSFDPNLRPSAAIVASKLRQLAQSVPEVR